MKPLNLFQLLQAAHHLRHRRVRKTRAPVGDADFADIDVALRIQREAVRREEFSGLEARAVLAAKPRDPLALGVNDGQARTQIRNLAIDRHARAELANDKIRLLAAAAVQRTGAMQIIPLRLVSAVAVEHLHAVVLTVRDIDKTVGVGCDVVDDIELAGIAAGLAPAFQQLPIRRAFVHAGIAVAVRDIDLALRRQRGVGAAVKRLAAHERRRLVRDADGKQHLAAGRALAHRMIAIVGAAEIIVGVDVQPMRAAEQVFAPASDKIAFAVEHDHRMGAAVEDVDAVLAVHGDRSDVGEVPLRRQLRPVLHHAVAIFARADNSGHVCFPFFLLPLWEKVAPFFLLPLWEKVAIGGLWPPSFNWTPMLRIGYAKSVPDEGSLSAERNPSPALDASHLRLPLPQGERGRKRQQPFLDRLDLQCQIFRVDPALREAPGDEPEAGLRGARVHVAQFLPLAKTPDRADALSDFIAEQLSHQIFLGLVAGRQHDQVGGKLLAALHPRTIGCEHLDIRKLLQGDLAARDQIGAADIEIITAAAG